MLSQAERERFAAWCEGRAASNDKVAGRMEQFPLDHAMAVLAERMRGEAAALRAVVAILRSIEGGEVG